ncbi:uncharacterized protein LOC124262453 isoform X1 [Haliotis rubra]|uniref:uncharacterized protein LOC124262453 isoform X1 n=1 Tax=Haliotis rubra TaxID=36100 RepID=UPI001EE529AF|nr:uncharacterized protein LOC124262453 isoform X1 [Haliotis rubra]
MYTSIFVKTLQSVAMATPPVAYVQPTVLTDNNEMTLSPKLAEDRESNPISWTTPHTANRRHLKILLCVSLAVVVLIVGVVSVLMCCHCGRCVSVKDAVPNDLQSQGSKMLGKMAAVKLPPKGFLRQHRQVVSAHLGIDLRQTEMLKDAVMVWKTSDSVYYKQGRLDILPNGTIRVGDTGTYQVTAHICLDGYRMNTTLAKYNLHFDILSDPPQHLLPD